MKITNAKIENFRNIKSSEFDLTQRTAIVGKNHIGKTNTIQAIYWLLTDTLIDGSNEVDTIISQDEPRATASVEITTDTGDVIKKTYKEKWVKTRGKENEETLQGHETTYSINGTPIAKISEAKQIINEKLLNSKTLANEYQIDLASALLNPLYLFAQVDYKKAREFIFSLVKEVKDSDVFNAYPQYIPISTDLELQSGRTDYLLKKYANDIKKDKEELAKQETLLENATAKMGENEVTDDELFQAQQTKNRINKAIYDLQNTPNSSVEYEEAWKRYENARNQLQEVKTAWFQEEETNNTAFLNEKNGIRYEISTLQGKIESQRKLIDEGKNAEEELRRKMKQIEAQILECESRRNTLLANYKAIKASQFEEDSITDVVCPQCGCVLNQEIKDKARADFESDKAKRLQRIQEQGTANNTEMSRLNAELEELKNKASNNTFVDVDSMELEISKLSQQKNQKEQLLNSITKKANSHQQELEEVKALSDKLLDEANTAKSAQEHSIEDRVATYKASVAEELQSAEDTLMKRVFWNSANADKNKCIEERKKLNKHLGECEQKQILAKAFSITKLEMIKDSTKKVFPDIDFVLFENNIKEGSFNQVCYPLIKGKETPFEHGSNSERILTGIAIIEDIRKALNLPQIPIIFDEGETLDSQSIKEIDTTSQVITTIVRDDFEKPQVVAL